ncbi:MAG: hypothetical protein KJZ87_28560, partial [Thermoguttaceae bacterium]|nr:hypothetical protein [Thermoguttaceae bacterium]
MRTVAVLWTVLLLVGPHLAWSAEGEITFDAVPADQWTGEPYELAGERLVFTSWYYVRPGGYAWLDAQNRGVTAARDQKL